MKSVLKIVPAACLAFALALGAVPATAQQQQRSQRPLRRRLRRRRRF